ncbi:hypothetical protein ACNPQM_38635 [Streptomyces sp. NPDC056231]|uniref:hypothetical protein n=1 Tax=Streptomyces sp. NPDC056231 TaxID=3345755 RepID=UPI003AAE3660
MPAILPGTPSTPLIRHEGGGVDPPEGIRGIADHTSPRPGGLEPSAQLQQLVVVPTRKHLSELDRLRRSPRDISLRFGQLRIRLNDHDRMAEHTVARMTGRQRRICGHFGRQPVPMDWYFPTDQATIMGREPATR